MQIFLKDSHAYPGCRADLPGDPPAAGTDVVLSFADGIEAPGRLSPTAEGLRLVIASYRTAAGTPIAPKAWLLRRDDAGWKIAARLPDPA
ncbi:hypothetical protein [Paracoccus siganidrum]|uniref:Nuclear transport factor 2 family protein n=1 Tax=Paracoccus siganidrum TaxID=1276757 RepID=A0A419A9R6_9RHOB|nr:hypothetical protein [Paracoccus siganidrum]RJL19201.1 hypothetical protein D3P05_05500 [Paracoccus siganidrum]RMC39261.1 hypothetical protein C9E82_04530 [Paracoccus siganidrum]